MAIYVHNCVLYNIVLSGPAELELIIVSLCKSGFKLCLGVFYRPPSSQSSIFDNLCETLLTVDQVYFSNFVLLGDFNVNFCNTHPLYSYISNLMSSLSLTQVVSSPTHFTSSTEQFSLIDLVFVSNINFYSECNTIPQLSNSDHYGVSLTMRHHHAAPVLTPRRIIWRYNLANFELANDLLCDIDFDEILDPGDIEESWRHFKTIFMEVMEQCIPKSVLPQRRNLPWLSKEIIQLIKKRNYYFKRARSNGGPNDLAKFRQLRNKVVSKLRIEKKTFFSELEPSNPKEFWKKLRMLSHKECSIPILSNESTTASTSLDKANLLNI